MKKVVFVFFLMLYLNTGSVMSSDSHLLKEAEKTGYVIKVKTNDIQDTYLYLSKRVSGSWNDIDSLLLSEGMEAVFKGSLKAPEILYLRLEGSDKVISFFAENSTITILPDFEEPDKSKVEGSVIHNEYLSYEELFSDINAQRKNLYDEYRAANSENDTQKVEELTAQFESLSEKETEINKNYVKSNPNSHVSPYVIRRNMYYTLSLDELKAIMNSLGEEVEDSPYALQLKEQISILETVAVGKKFTDFRLPTPDGGELALSEIANGKYVLIDFWASWCGPCRRENPNVVAMYEKFLDKGFEILGVSLDNNGENWKKAIEDDKLTWYHVSDLKGWGSEAGKLYGVSSIPHTVLLGPDGTIIEKNLRGEALESKLAELLL